MGATGRMIAKVVVMCCIAASTAWGGIAHAGFEGCDDGGFSGKHHRQDFRRIARKLALTEAQKAQAKAIFQGKKDLVKPLYANLRAEKQNLQSLIHADTVDEAAIRAETAKIAGIQADLHIQRAKTEAEFRAILTPSQQATLKAMYQKRQRKGVKAPPATEQQGGEPQR